MCLIIERNAAKRGVLGLQDGEQIAHVKIAVKFGLLFTGQIALTSQFRQLVHACDVGVAKTN